MRRYQRLAHRVAFMVTGSGADAEDAAQVAFIKAYHALGRFDRERPFRPWLLAIVTNEAKNRRRWAARHPELELEAVSDREDAGQPPPEDAAVRAERRALLLRAVNALRPGDRQVIAYRYFLDLSEAEMAQALGVASGTVKSRLSRALGRLRRALEGSGVDLGTVEAAGE